MSDAVMMTIFLLVYTSTVTGQSCPDTWELEGQKCYKFLVQDSDWGESKAYCTSVGGALLVLDSDVETQYLVQKMNFYSGHTHLGCQDVVTEGHWVCDGYDPSLTFFDVGGSSSGIWSTTGGTFSPEGGVTENCLEIYPWGGDASLNDVSCATRNPLVSCRRELMEIVTTPEPTTITEPTIPVTEPTTEAPQPTTTPATLIQPTTEPQQTTTASPPPAEAPAESSLSHFALVVSQFISASIGECPREKASAQVKRRIIGCARRCTRAQSCLSFNVIQDGDGSISCRLSELQVATDSLAGSSSCVAFNKLER